jgi:starch phosphorylase
MWSTLWPDRRQEDVPIGAITNGVHLPTWIEPTRLQHFLDGYLGSEWTVDRDRAQTWAGVDEIPDADLWHLHQDLKVMLIDRITERNRRRWQEEGMATGSVVAFGALLDPEALTIGFARRFTDYKRPDLLFYDVERARRLLTDPWYPVQVIFAGKAHPSDVGGKRLIQRIFRLAEDRQFAGRIAFVENYDQGLAQYLVHGVDVWLNNPLPPLEASGTSGVKACANGVPHLSILDGWWLEGYNGSNGWAFGGEEMQGDRAQADAEALYRLLEDEIIPLYYERSDDQVPHDFVRIMKEAIKSVAPAFSAQRMVKEYVSHYYLPALGLNKD